MDNYKFHPDVVFLKQLYYSNDNLHTEGGSNPPQLSNASGALSIPLSLRGFFNRFKRKVRKTVKYLGVMIGL